MRLPFFAELSQSLYRNACILSAIAYAHHESFTSIATNQFWCVLQVKCKQGFLHSGVYGHVTNMSTVISLLSQV